MDNIVLDECLSNLLESEELMREYKPLDEFTTIFESDDPKVKEQEKKNETVISKVVEKLKNALKALKDFFNRMVESIKNFIDLRKMDKAEKEAYYAFKQAAKEDPSLKDKKITVSDYTQLLQDYSDNMNEYAELFQKYYRTPSDDLSDRLSNMLNQGLEKAGDLAKAPTTSMKVETALRLAAGNKKYAKELAKQLKNDKETMDALEKRLGEKNAKKIEKEVNSLQHMISFTRLKMKLTGRAAKTLDKATLGVFEDVSNGVFNASQAFTKDKDVGSIGDAIGRSKDAKKSLLSFKKSGVGKTLGNPTIGAGYKTAKKVGATVLADKISKKNNNKTIYGSNFRPKNISKRAETRLAKSIDKSLRGVESPTGLEPFFAGYTIGKSTKKPITKVGINDVLDSKGMIINRSLYNKIYVDDPGFFKKINKEQQKRIKAEAEKQLSES